MKAIRKAGIALLALGVGFISGCERHSTKKEVFYMVTANAGLPYWQTAASGFNHAAAEYKVTAKVVGPDGYDAQAELAELNKAIAAKPAGILISVADAAVLQPQIDAAINAGIPVITVDSDAAASRRLFFIGTNNLQAGELGGKRLIEKLNGKGNILVFTLRRPAQHRGAPQGTEGRAGRPSLKSRSSTSSTSRAIRAPPSTRHRKCCRRPGPRRSTASSALESASGKMVSDAIKRGNNADRVLVAFDVNQDTLDGIKGGTIDSTIAQKALHHGLCGAEGSRRDLPQSAEATGQGLQR